MLWHLMHFKWTLHLSMLVLVVLNSVLEPMTDTNAVYYVSFVQQRHDYNIDGGTISKIQCTGVCIQSCLQLIHLSMTKSVVFFF